MKKTEGQVLPFPTCTIAITHQKEHQCQARLQVQGAPSSILSHEAQVRMGTAEGTEKGLGPFTYHWPHRPNTRAGTGPRWHSSV